MVPGASISRLRLSLLGTLFIVIVFAIVSYRHTVFLPFYIGLITWLKASVKVVTPKLMMLIAKNGALIRLRQIVVSMSTHFFILSHKPWRRRLLALRKLLLDQVKGVFGLYMALPLWLRTVIALLLLVLTASSSYVFIAVLIIPQPLMNWMRQQFFVMLNKLGVTQFFNAIWRFVIPESFRYRWHMYSKWTLGRRQVAASRKLFEKVRQQKANLLSPGKGSGDGANGVADKNPGT